MSGSEILFVIALGLGTVFVGLICIIILCKIVSAFCNMCKGEAQKPTEEIAPAATNLPIQNKQEIIAAVSAAIAEELGKDISAIRILSFKKI